MFAMRHSGARRANPNVRQQRATRGEGNVAWLRRSDMNQGVVLLGGAGLTDFRLRVAQSRLRSDLTPSHWSNAALLTAGELITVDLARIGDPGEFAARNGVTRLPLARFDDPRQYPNVAVFAFGLPFGSVLDALDDIVSGRAVLDVPALAAVWLAALWGVDDLDAPLRDGRGMPGAALVELAHAIAGIELTPGLESTASCPEAIWQSARWWTEYYRESAAMAMRAGAAPTEGHAMAAVPAGAYVIRSRLVAPQPTSPKELVKR